MKTFPPKVYIDHNARPLIVFARGRKLYHAVTARDSDITIASLDSLRYLRPLTRKGVEYPARRAASFWLNRDFRIVTKRARQVLKGLVARKEAVS